MSLSPFYRETVGYRKVCSMVWWTTPGPPKLTEAQEEAASENSRMVVEVFSVILRELYATPIEELIDVPALRS